MPPSHAPTRPRRAASSPPSRSEAGPLLHAADARGVARLGVDAVSGVTDIVEAMHAAIARPSWPIGPAGPARTAGITGFVYRAVRGSTQLVGRGLEAAIDGIDRARSALGPDAGPAAPSIRREALLAALNGVWGDHLVASGNPLAIPMTLRVEGRVIDPACGPAPGHDGRRLLVLAHGLCMNDLQWRRGGHDHGEALARAAGWTPLYLHYNSGRHVAENGHAFAALLEDLVSRWPVPIDEIAIVGHSMGGLLARSACHLGALSDAAWLAKLSTLVFLGTPHHGAPLERGGHVIDRVLGASPYVAPFARLGRARSAGITDLRHGALRDEDHISDDRFVHAHDTRVPTPLPEGVRAFVIAATTAERTGGRLDASRGDGLVPLASALGDHPDRRFALGVPRARRFVVTEANHWDLLDRPQVTARLLRWLP